MPATSFLTAHAAAPDWSSAVAQCIEQLRPAVAAHARLRHPVAFTLGWCYFTDYFAPDAEQLLGALQQAFPGTHWIGSVGVGVAATGVEHFDEPALAVMLAPLPPRDFRLFSGRQPLRAHAHDTAHPTDFTAHTALVHADATTPDLQDLLRELAERTETGYLFGGLSVARNRSVQIADEVFSGGLSGVAFSERVHIVSRVTQGCRPVGPMRTITRAEDNIVVALDGRPALECVFDDLRLDGDMPVEDLAEALSETLVGLRTREDDMPGTPGRFGPDTVVRHIVGIDPGARVLAVANEVCDDMRLTLCERNADAAMADLLRIASEIRDTLAESELEPVGGVLVSCSGRGGPHFGHPNAELDALRQVLGELPLVGFYAGGEIARDRLYGYTAVLSVFAQPRA
ncbi:MAG: FIST N-terminal domain-containing protein [Rhodocyclaceae bacterium]